MADQTLTVTVTQADPLMVTADGADTPSPAAAIEGLELLVDDRVQVTVRTPQQPLVTGKETTA